MDEAELQDIDFDIDLQQFPVGPAEARAEKVLRINDAQLRRYYNLNLSQNYWVFGLGVTCVAAGIALVAATLHLVSNVATDEKGRVVIAAVGAVGAVLSNFVAAIFLRIHASAAANLGAFHARLVETHQQLLGNLVASRIEDDGLRWKTLADLALNLSKVPSGRFGKAEAGSSEPS